jgi:DHA1 family tetracycline resistance protein-like MFS transporter
MQKRTLPVLFITLLIDMIGIGMIIPIIPVIFTNPASPEFLLAGYSIQMQYLVAGLVTALFGLMQFLAAPLLGELSDVYGRKKLLTLGVAVLALSQMLFGFGIQIGSLALILFSRLIAGIAGANFSIAQASIADVTAPADRAKNFGLIGAAFGVGFILGPLLGGWIAGLTHHASSPFFLAGILGVINLMSITYFLPETHTNRVAAKKFHLFKGIQNIKHAATDLHVRHLYLANFLYISGFTFFTTFVGIFLGARFGLNETAIGTFFGVVGVWMVLTQIFVVRTATRLYSERQILRVALVLQAISLISYALAPTIWVLYAIIPFTAIAAGLSMATMGALVSKSAGVEKQGAALGINGSLQALSQGVIPLLAGVAGGMGLATPFILGAGLVVVAWGVLFVVKR